MIILGIETSCDETSIAVLKNTKILSNVVGTQQKIHEKFFGVVPELASRAHTEKINYIFEKALKLSKITVSDISAVAYTSGPGLMGSLLVGQMFAQTIAYVRGIPLVPVNHIEAHMDSAMISNSKLSHPFLSLIVSGGHTQLVICNDFGKYKVLGKTRDDACGEAFDKVAKMLNLGYPGGPLIQKLSQRGNSDAIKFPRPYMWNTWDFSFSGLKTAVMYYLKNIPKNKINVNNVCASFQQAVVDTLVNKTVLCTKKFNLKRVVIAGGVAANNSLRKTFLQVSHKNRIKVFFPELKLCTDNAAMIAYAGYHKLNKSKNIEKFNDFTSNSFVDSDLELENW